MRMLTRRDFTAAGIIATLSLAAASGASLTGCAERFDSSDNEPTALYGPPPDEDEPSEEASDSKSSERPDVDSSEKASDSMSSQSGGYDPSDNENEDVYGPPPDDVDESGTSVDDGDGGSSDDDQYSAEENIPAALYGPPPEKNPSL